VGRLWLTGLRLFDGTGGPPRDDVAVLVEDGVIRRVAGTPDEPPRRAWSIDAGGRVLLPGLIDAHTHTAGRTLATSTGRRKCCQARRGISCRQNCGTTCAGE
jgi:N-acyl-D-aspartate/D-glutamate deacylase